jgi:DNA-binding FadR family transcriptional regulator
MMFTRVWHDTSYQSGEGAQLGHDDGESLHEAVLDRLGGAVVRGEIPAASVLRIDQIEADYRVSRTVIREVLRVLESMGLVAIRRRVGVTVRPRTGWNPFDPRIIRWRLAGSERHDQLRALGELRSGIEPTAARLAALRATPEQCGALTGAVIGMSVTAKRGDLAAYLDHDSVFHRTLLAASGNEMFSGLADVVVELLAGRTHHHLMPSTPNAAAIRLHADVAEAVQSGDPDTAEDAMRAIVREATAALARHAPQPPPESA